MGANYVARKFATDEPDIAIHTFSQHDLALSLTTEYGRSICRPFTVVTAGESRAGLYFALLSSGLGGFEHRWRRGPATEN